MADEDFKVPSVRFVLTEMRRTGDGKLAEAYPPTSFEWDVEHRSSPRDSWEYELSQRTVREDYPGGQEPTEQMLGPRYEPFSLRGVWDDRYNYGGFADITRMQVEKLVGKGSICRVTLDNLSFFGVLTKLKITYRWARLIGYELTLSPHSSSAQVVKVNFGKVFDPNQHARLIDDQIAAALKVHEESKIQPYTVGDIYQTVATWLATIRERMSTITGIIEGRLLAVSDPGLVAGEIEKISGVGIESKNSVERLQRAFETMRTEAWGVLDSIASATTTNSLAYDSAMSILEFEDWMRAISFLARTIMVKAQYAAEQMRTFIKPDILAVYRPYRGENFYSISNKFYGTPHKWGAIMERNDLYTFVLTGFETLIIPRDGG